jgi:hypothetical protein
MTHDTNLTCHNVLLSQPFPEESIMARAPFVNTLTGADGAAMERLAAPVAVPKSETRCPASGACGGGAADKGRSAAGGATTAALAARLSA